MSCDSNDIIYLHNRGNVHGPHATTKVPHTEVLCIQYSLYRTNLIHRLQKQFKQWKQILSWEGEGEGEGGWEAHKIVLLYTTRSHYKGTDKLHNYMCISSRLRLRELRKECLTSHLSHLIIPSSMALLHHLEYLHLQLNAISGWRGWIEMKVKYPVQDVIIENWWCEISQWVLRTSAISSIHPPWPSCITQNISNSSCTLTWLPIANGETTDSAALGSVPAVAVGLAGEGVAIAVAAVAGEKVATAAGVGTAGAVVYSWCLSWRGRSHWCT